MHLKEFESETRCAVCLGKHFLKVVQAALILTAPRTSADASVTVHGCLKVIRTYDVSMHGVYGASPIAEPVFSGMHHVRMHVGKLSVLCRHCQGLPTCLRMHAPFLLRVH